MSFKVAFLLSCGGLSGGAKVILEYAERLALFFPWVETTVFVRDQVPQWFFPRYCEVTCASFESISFDKYHVVVLTSPDQVEVYKKWYEKVAMVHLCQGFEVDYLENLGLEHLRKDVEEFYSLSCTRLVVNGYLKKRLEAFCKDRIVNIGQPLPFGYPRKPLNIENKLRMVLVIGSFLYPFKGVKDALNVAWYLKKLKGLQIVRLSPHNTLNLEKRFSVDVFATAPPSDMPSLYRNALLTVYMPYKDGFGLPVLESMACGTPVIARDIPPIRETCGNDYPLFSSVEEALKFAVRLCEDRKLYKELVEKGYKRLRRFNPKWISFKLLTVLIAEKLSRFLSLKKNLSTV